MNILIAMAGDGKRFIGSGYKTIKPLIKLKGKTILEWTTGSLPFIKHYNKSAVEKNDYKLAFAIRTEHDKEYNLSEKLKKIYGRNIKIKLFDSLTRGNLETAFLSIKELFGPEAENDELLILDADNHYNGNNFLFYKNTFKEYSTPNECASICYFYPKDNVPKWCFAKIDKETNKVISLHEKEKVENSWPMVGVFYFSKTSLFVNLAEEIINSDKKVKNEFYMSQAVQSMLDKNMDVYGIGVSSVCPLGTPEDVKEYSKFLNQIESEQKEAVEAKEEMFRITNG